MACGNKTKCFKVCVLHNKHKTKLYELYFYLHRFNIFIEMCNYHLWLIMSDFLSYLFELKIQKYWSLLKGGYW